MRADPTSTAHEGRWSGPASVGPGSRPDGVGKVPNICNGDSGGPVFDDGAVVALGNYVANARCQGTNSGPRLDIEPVNRFLKAYVD